MPYDASLDVEVFSRAVENEAGRLSVKVMSYNEGAKKLQISRERRGAEGDFKFAKLGRMLKEEAESVLPLIQEALAKM
ncbi:MAG: hypothetical protein QGI05_01175 [Candidatus Omnitrophota bacterium]|nr:hypothetical protein [Candidatus Omnitrophota bacterium]